MSFSTLEVWWCPHQKHSTDDRNFFLSALDEFWEFETQNRKETDIYKYDVCSGPFGMRASILSAPVLTAVTLKIHGEEKYGQEPVDPPILRGLHTSEKTYI